MIVGLDEYYINQPEKIIIHSTYMIHDLLVNEAKEVEKTIYQDLNLFKIPDNLLDLGKVLLGILG